MLPEWAAAPGPGWEHDNNYSPLEIVWTNTTTGEQRVQTARYTVAADDVTPADIVTG